MTDIAVAGPVALQPSSPNAISTQPVDESSSIPAHTVPAPPSNAFDDHSSQGSSESQQSRPTALKLSTSDVSPTLRNAIEELTPLSSAGSNQNEVLKPNTTSPVKENPRPEADQTIKQQPRSQNGSQSPPQAGTKRTASGEVKRASMSNFDALLTNSQNDNALKSEATGNAGNVREISQQLRTKLKYAMVKVQNGWQSRSLDEVESLASASPRSAISGYHSMLDNGPQASPRTAMSNKLRKWSESDSSDSAKSDVRSAVLSAPHPITSIRHHSGNPRGLAPPANIIPGTRRRPMPNSNAPLYSIGGPHGQIRHLNTARPGVTHRTPSQNAAMEADAVETLLFMASPSNSGYHPTASQSTQESSLRSTQNPTSQLTSPLRAQFSQTSVTSPKRVAFTDQPAGNIDPRTDRSSLIDQMLEDISDGNDSELEQALARAEKASPTSHTTKIPT